ncbi:MULTISPECIES: hypothetical protein [Pseudomonas]|uniref:Plastocyanin-like domain-containing protein n=1 Tax=Pseudomonas azadiae TaxID=2843612 RepID=A0ABS6NY53_9PSED|nr:MULTISPECIES: hypothetical protein [Pseudomonas]MBV4453142.1 hypothetical protein [Pseudomonas azadiae]NMF38859.1 hypothetical protein [Pseudomonas sp. SWRI 103]
MPSYKLENQPTAYYYPLSPVDPKQIPLNPKICINRSDPNCIDYNYPGINMPSHAKTSGFNLMSDPYATMFKKGDGVRFRIINITKGAGSYRSSFNAPMAWDTAFSAIITVGEMNSLGTGNQLILMDIYSISTDTYHICAARKIEFTP